MVHNILEIKDLQKSYTKGNPILKGIDLTFEEGEFAVVIGPSGAGKSTFIRCINRMIDPSGGKLVFDGESTGSLKGKSLRAMRRKIGMVFQHHNLVGRTNVIRNVLHGRLGYMPFFQSFFGCYSDEDRLQAAALLEKVGLSGQMYQRADALSGGQMQRVGICRAMIQQPRLLLADEPIASLDPKSANIVMESLRTITQDQGVTCIINLHQVDFARKYATRIIGIKDGRVVFDGKPSELTDDIAAHIYEGKEAQMTLEGIPAMPAKLTGAVGV